MKRKRRSRADMEATLLRPMIAAEDAERPWWLMRFSARASPSSNALQRLVESGRARRTDYPWPTPCYVATPAGREWLEKYDREHGSDE